VKHSLVSIVIPCYQSAGNVPELTTALQALYDQLPEDVKIEIVIVDDGSTDGSFQALEHLKEILDCSVVIVKLSGNFGSYPAFLAGLHFAKGDCCVQLHADLQDPPDHIPEMIKHWKNGFKLVIGQRIDREEPGLYTMLAKMYHRMIKTIALPYIPEGGYDLILFDRSLRDHIVNMNESNTNLVYLISWLRYPYVTVPVVRRKRIIGESQWTFSKRIKLVIDSLVSFSYFPIRMVSLGALINLLLWAVTSITGLAGIYPLVFMDWLAYTALTGIFISISVVAEYLWRTLEATRKRPPFIIDKVINSHP